jgi:hypothetical protein
MNSSIAALMACAIASTSLSAVVATSAEAAPAAGAYKAPRNGLGQPDLTGTWSNETLTRMERNPNFGTRITPTPAEVAQLENARSAAMANGNKQTDLTKSVHELNSKDCDIPGNPNGANCSYNSAWVDGSLRMMRVGGQPRNSLVTFPADGRIPRKPNDKPRVDVWAEGNRDNPENRGLADRCLVGQNISTGALLNPTLYNNNYVIQQGKDSVAIVVEMSHDVRNVRLNAQHDNIPRWFGDSVGHWEGDTLVVDTVGFHPLQLVNNSDKLHLVERFTRVGPDRILYQFKVEDPGAYTAAWGGEYEFTTAKSPQYEYACHEGNYGLLGILEGARAEEKSGKAATRTALAEGATGEEE